MTFDVRVPHDPGRVSTIRVRFTELPVNRWSRLPQDEKRVRGIVGCQGVSFVRAGREIDWAWHCVGSKRRENYDDWWRCEINFEPELDELFGVTHSKQGVNPTEALKAILAADVERVARLLNSRVRRAFERAKAESPSKAARRAQRQEALLPPLYQRLSANRLRCDERRTVRLGRFEYRFEAQDLGQADFFDVVTSTGQIRVILNTNHPFYSAVYVPACADATSPHRFQLECLLLAAARAVIEVPSKAAITWLTARRAWSDALAAFLDPAR